MALLVTGFAGEEKRQSVAPMPGSRPEITQYFTWTSRGPLPEPVAMATDHETFDRNAPEGLGPQAAGIAKLIAAQVPRGARVRDIGCGQGRDALPLARDGCDVLGVDITRFTPEGHVGLLLCNRTLRMLPAPSRTAVRAGLLAVIRADPAGWALLHNSRNTLRARRPA
jgi:tellurite methyltransferase